MARPKTHGESRTRLYTTYKGMKDRCYNAKNADYCRYGEKGITVTQEWIDDFLVFKHWATNNGYEDSLTIDRIDSSLGYCPENCRWIPFDRNSKGHHADLLVLRTDPTTGEEKKYISMRQAAIDF